MISSTIKHEIVKNLIQIEKALLKLLARRKSLDKIKINLRVETTRELEKDPEIKELNSRIESLTDQIGI